MLPLFQALVPTRSQQRCPLWRRRHFHTFIMSLADQTFPLLRSYQFYTLSILQHKWMFWASADVLLQHEVMSWCVWGGVSCTVISLSAGMPSRCSDERSVFMLVQVEICVSSVLWKRKQLKHQYGICCHPFLRNKWTAGSKSAARPRPDGGASEEPLHVNLHMKGSS